MNDSQTVLSNPRILSACFFGLLSVFATYLIESYLFYFGVIRFLPLFKSLMLAVIVSASFGAIFANKILLTDKPYRKKAFFWGFVMALCAVPFHALGLLVFIQSHHPLMLDDATNFMHYVDLYFFTLAYSFLLAGFWLSIAAGFAAMFLRGHLEYFVCEREEHLSRHAPIRVKKAKSHHKPLTH